MPDPNMNTPPDPPPDRRSPFEWSLAALRPADADVARPSFMFNAGQASRQKAVWFWRCVAGGLGVAMAAGGLAGFGLVQAEQQRAAATVAELTAAHAPRSTITTVPTPDLTDPSPAVVTQPVAPRHTPAAEEAPPSEIAAALDRRRNILVGGLGLIPDAPPVLSPEVPKTTPTYPGVFAAPRVEKRLPPDPDPEPDPP